MTSHICLETYCVSTFASYVFEHGEFSDFLSHFVNMRDVYCERARFENPIETQFD